MLLALFLFIFGLCVGSFLNVVIDRLPRGEGFWRGRSYCEHCHHTLGWLDLVPLLSFVLLRGRCRYCNKKISWQYPLVELSTGLLFASSLFLPSTPYLLNQASILYLLSSVFLAPIFVIDLKHGIIPDKLVFPAIVIALSSSALQPYLAGRQVFSSGAFLATLFASAVLYSLFSILHFAFQGKALGGGDVKLAFLVGLVTGWPEMLVAIFSAFLTGAVVSVILILLGKKKFGETVPFGPFLVVGTYTALFWGDEVLKWYLGLL